MMPSTRMLERVLQTVAERHDVRADAMSNDGMPIQRVADPSLEMHLILPFVRGRFRISERDLALNDAARLIEIIEHMVTGTAAEMRGTEILRWLDKGLPIDFFGNLSEEPEHMRAERVATKLAELAEILFKRSQRKSK